MFKNLRVLFLLFLNLKKPIRNISNTKLRGDEKKEYIDITLWCDQEENTKSLKIFVCGKFMMMAKTFVAQTATAKKHSTKWLFFIIGMHKTQLNDIFFVVCIWYSHRTTTAMVPSDRFKLKTFLNYSSAVVLSLLDPRWNPRTNFLKVKFLLSFSALRKFPRFS